jgi:predicted TIM-barrel fold metal-dependent hydrolase
MPMPTMDFDSSISPTPDGSNSLERLLAWDDAAGVELAVVMAPPDIHPDNHWIYTQIKDEPRCIGCAIINPTFGAAAVAELARCVEEYGFRGMKLQATAHGYPIEADLVDPVMEKAAQLGVVVTIHSGSEFCSPAQIGLLAGRHPGVPIVMDHMGYRYHVGQAIAAARLFPNLYLGTTVANNEPGTVLEAIRKVGPERVVYGSNAPASYPDLAVAALKRLNLDPTTERLLLGDNLARLYRILSP